MKTKEPKVFTLQEAKNTLPYVKIIVNDIVEVQKKLDSFAKDQAKETNPYYQGLLQEMKEFQKELSAVGCYLKNAKLGMVGYYWDQGNGTKELHWQVGEQDIYYWKEIGGTQLNLLDNVVEKLEEINPRVS